METIPPTEQELVKFHAYLRAKGLMNERTAYSRIQAAQAVLSALDANEKSDLTKIDRDLVFRRFVNKNGQRFSPDSLDTYRHRFNAALNEFLNYVKDPAGYRPPEIARARPSAPASTSQSSRARSAARPSSPLRQVEATGDLLAYPLPLPSGAVAQLLVPPNLTKGDAQRLLALVSAMVNALAVQEESA